MQSIIDSITEWIKEMLVAGITGNLSGMFENVNQSVGEIAGEVGKTPSAWNGGVFSMIQSLSETVIIPIAGIILTFVMCYELIQMVIEKNNLHDIETFMFFKWIFKTFVAVMIITNTFNIIMGIFDMSQHIVSNAAGVIVSDASIDITAVIADMETRLMDMELGLLLGIWLQSMFVGLTMHALTICIFIVIYGRTVSTAYTLMKRCGLNTEGYFEHEDFLSIFDFNTADAVALLGTAVSEQSEQVFRQISLTIIKTERERRKEHERNHLQQERGLSDTRHHIDTEGRQQGTALGQIRENEETVPSGTQDTTIPFPAPVGETISPLNGNRSDSQQEAHADKAALYFT